MTLTVNFHCADRADHCKLPGGKNDTLEFSSADGKCIVLYVPPHVAEHTAAAFNRSMQAVPDGSGWTYTTKSGVWHIRCPMPRLYLAQHDDITGDNDPAWMFADGKTLIGCMDEIDATEEDNGCTRCATLTGLENLREIGRGKDMEMLCDDCAKAEAEHERELAEMAADDIAHAAREKEMGL